MTRACHRQWSADEQVFTDAGEPLSDWDETRTRMWSAMTGTELLTAPQDLFAAAPKEGTP